jgi:lactate dehydrogenase-like 2-hydroxyacid dehydrogenase
VDEPALARALAAGQIAGAGLDVFAAEPAVDPELLAGDRVVLAPHAGSATTTARKAMAQICANSVRAVLDGRRPDAVINPEVYA